MHWKMKQIRRKVEKANIDNVSRTIMYERFYQQNPEIRWSLLAGLVSRNAGWNMTDLESKWFQQLLTQKYRDLLFHTYERANWTIFQDVYPQLLWYEYAKTKKEPQFELLDYLGVSKFMQTEWKYFWKSRNEERLCTALIVNEQYTIEEVVMKQPLYKENVFSSIIYFLEEHAHMSYVIFPTTMGRVYGLYVRNFKHVKARIWLGRQLSSLLFHPIIHEEIYKFSICTVPTGSRRDYEQYMGWSTGNTSPRLREQYPVITHHWYNKKDWSLQESETEQFFSTLPTLRPTERTKWLQRKWAELYVLQKVKDLSVGRK
ncbi:DUF2515 family protein [Halalkalibacter kiskunsagensis]|uniref:DUF2515 family protein n=1 Tax=Halalkalibacter kiskunsagensis TaxID=1548599 RepID=A0ABV6KAA6_9BACI